MTKCPKCGFDEEGAAKDLKAEAEAQEKAAMDVQLFADMDIPPEKNQPQYRVCKGGAYKETDLVECYDADNPKSHVMFEAAHCAGLK
jgi:hypothetical protein